jgi:adenylate cyclase
VSPSPDEVREQLDRVLASREFAGTERLRRFLRYIVEQALAGDGAGFKEYAIGTAVYDRPESFDPRVDSIVRVEAGRLRTKLNEYYNGAGLADPWRITMPKGSYVPVFDARNSTTPEPAISSAPPARRTSSVVWTSAALGLLLLLALIAWRIRPPAPVVHGHTVAVLPFATYSGIDADRRLAAEITDGVTSELARLGTVDVVSHTSAAQFAPSNRRLSDIASALGADVVMEARVTVDGDRVRVTGRLVDAARDRKIWVEDFTGTRADLPSLHRRVAQAVAAAASRPRTP